MKLPPLKDPRRGRRKTPGTNLYRVRKAAWIDAVRSLGVTAPEAELVPWFDAGFSAITVFDEFKPANSELRGDGWTVSLHWPQDENDDTRQIGSVDDVARLVKRAMRRGVWQITIKSPKPLNTQSFTPL